MKKICTFFGLLISMCLLLNVGFGSLSVKGAAAGNTEQTSDPNFTNLIVFARFADENECKFCSNGTPILKLAVHPF